MDLNELKSTWQHAGEKSARQPNLKKMTHLTQHPKVRRIKVKFVIEIIALVAFLATYYDILDGAARPVWVNAFFVASVILYAAGNAMGFLTLLNPVSGGNLVDSLHRLQAKLRRMMVFSLTTSGAFATCLVLFLTFNITFTSGKYALLAGIVLSVMIMMYFSYRNWQQRIRQIRQALEGLSD